jgi:hypothetical protein
MIGMLEGRARPQDQHRPPLLPRLRPALRRRRPRPLLGHRVASRTACTG